MNPFKVDPSNLDPSKMDPFKVDPTKVEPTKVDNSEIVPSKVDLRKFDLDKVTPEIFLLPRLLLARLTPPWCSSAQAFLSPGQDLGAFRKVKKDEQVL